MWCFRFFDLVFCLPVLFCAINTTSAQQQVQLVFQPTYLNKPIALNSPLRDLPDDSLAIHTLKFYLGNFNLLLNGKKVWSESVHRLLDMEDDKSMRFPLEIPANLQFDALQFELGVDSLHNISGALSGDLDPSKGMYWAWQSGYINLKMEGYDSRCPTRSRKFQWHLGGYLTPHQSVQTVRLAVQKKPVLVIDLELAPVFETMDWQGKTGIMSPSAEAVGLMKLLARQFRVHE